MRIRSSLERFAPFPDLTPLIDCVFLLLLFFAVTFSFAGTESGIALELPEARFAPPHHASALEVTVTSENKILLGRDLVSSRELGRRLRELAPPRPGLTIQADRRALVDTVVGVWDTAREAGFREVEILTRAGT